MNKVSWGVVSTGRIANSFAQDCLLSEHSEIAAVGARNLSSAEAFASKYDIGKACEGYQALFDDPNIDAVYIATPHTLHFDHASAALRAGKAVLCEKPMTVSAAESNRLLQVAHETGSYLLEAMWTWFLPAIRTARRWVDDGRIGNLLHVKADFGYPQVYAPDKREYDAGLAGGCLLEMGIYPVAIADYFFQREPDAITATARFAPNGVEDDVSMIYDYGEDGVATLGTSFRCRQPNHAFIVGDAGYIAIPDFFRASECHLYVLDQQVDTFNDGRSSIGFEYEIAAVEDDLFAGRIQSPIVPLETSLRFQRVMDATRNAYGN